jgi:hypothetical protein
MKTLDGWISVSLEGFAEQNQARPKEHLVKELVQNAMDSISNDSEGEINIDMAWKQDKQLLYISCQDNGIGVEDLENMRTVFWTSKKDTHLKRGRMGRGFKEMLCLCQKAQVTSRGKMAHFTTDKTGQKVLVIEDDCCQSTTNSGTKVEMWVKWDKDTINTIGSYLESFLVPPNIIVKFNGIPIEKNEKKHTIKAPLTTESFDGTKWVKPNITTHIELHPLKGDEERGLIYEMGIPICPIEWDISYHANVLQRVPMNPNRDAVMSGYPQKLHKACLEAVIDELNSEQARSSWVGDAASACKDPKLQKKVLTIAFGNNLARSVPSFGKFDHDADARELTNVKILDTKQLSGGFRELVKSHLPTSKELADKIYKEAATTAANNTVDLEDAKSQYKKIIDMYGKEKIKEVCSFHKMLADQIMAIIFGENAPKCTVKTAIMQGTAEATWSNQMSILTLALDLERIWKEPLDKENFSLIIHETAHEIAAHHGESFANAVEKCAGAACSILIDKNNPINKIIDSLAKNTKR